MIAVPAAAAVSAAGYFLWLGPHVPESDTLQIVGYTVVITIMLAAAAARKPGPGKGIALTAGILFYVSDVFLANWRYVDTGSWNAYVCYPVYYTACALFALSVLPTTRES